MSQLARRCSVSYSSGSPCYSRTGGNIFPPHKQMSGGELVGFYNAGDLDKRFNIRDFEHYSRPFTG